MFQDRLIQIMEELNLTNGVLAGYADLDRTTISKYKNGSRIPGRNSSGDDRIVQGICKFANTSEQMEQLMTFLKVDDVDQIQKRLYQFLFEDTVSDEDKENVRDKDSLNRTSFGTRLDAVMTLAEMSNVRLSRLINVDASLISRYRSGIRSPKSNLQIQNALCEILMERVIYLEKREELAKLCGIPVELLNREAFQKWLFSFEEINQLLINAASQITFSLDQFSVMSSQLPDSFQELLKAYLINHEQQVYRGYDGLRSAVIRFLLSAIQKKTKNIWLYSDHDISWMTSDSSFTKLWALLMVGCAKNGVHIHIVHNLNRNMEEMVSAIKTWIPLYMTGMLDSYYYTQNPSDTFSHTFFFSPEVACIEACHVRGTEKEGFFNYRTDPERMTYYMEAFQAFMNNTNSLIKVYQQAADAIDKASIVILPEEIQIGNSANGEEIQHRPISENPFKNVKISIGEDFVGVTRLIEPELTFYLTHPLLYNAFYEYYKSIDH